MTRYFFLSMICLFWINASAQTKPPILTGRWIGSYGNNEKNNPYYFSFAFAADSTFASVVGVPTNALNLSFYLCWNPP